ncbi:MAG TPA: chemotaxis protein CheW [Chryseolinea sp.]|nr:chemotaxis protein CheW [Chryseolinea sp.]
MTNNKPCLLFTLCKEHFGIYVENVLRVISLEKLMVVPKAPDFIAGAISLEGNVIPVVDLAKKIELNETEIGKSTKVIILQVTHGDDTIEVGVMIDDVLDVITLQESKLLPPALERMGFDTQTLDGMYKVEEDFYMILNPTKVFEKELATIA